MSEKKSIFQKWTHFNNFGQSCDPWLKGASATLPKAKQIQWLHVITWMDNRTNHVPTNGPWKANTSPLPHHQAGKIWFYRCMWKEEYLEPFSGKSHVLHQQAKDLLSSSFILWLSNHHLHHSHTDAFSAILTLSHVHMSFQLSTLGTLFS